MRKKKPTTIDGRTIDLIRRGVISANDGTIDKNRAVKLGILPPLKQKTQGGKDK